MPCYPIVTIRYDYARHLMRVTLEAHGISVTTEIGIFDAKYSAADICDRWLLGSFDILAEKLARENKPVISRAARKPVSPALELF